MVKRDIVELFQAFHTTGSFVKSLISTSIVLIAKSLRGE